MLKDIEGYFEQHPQARAMVALIKAALMSLQAIHTSVMETEQEQVGTTKMS
jgi:hypothetical protein